MAIPGLKLELLEVNHFPEVTDFFHEHYKEPLDAALGISDEDSKKFLEGLASSCYV